ncbi:MAG: hypothetical protein IV086_00245 [Hyphomonadaceae bacterium]|nr:hypothetical protein [Hyphomonadaceae bacterium]
MGRRSFRGGSRTFDLRQLGLPFDISDPATEAAGVALPTQPPAAAIEITAEAEAHEPPRVAPSGTPALSSASRSRITFWPGFMGRRPPPPPADEQPLNTKRAAHHLGRSSRWLELVRHSENSPPWIKKGGLFEYYPSHLDWWLKQLAET